MAGVHGQILVFESALYTSFYCLSRFICETYTIIFTKQNSLYTIEPLLHNDYQKVNVKTE